MKKSKYHIPEGVEATFGNWEFLENVYERGKAFKYRVRCCCGEERTQDAYQIVKGKIKMCSGCRTKKLLGNNFGGDDAHMKMMRDSRKND